MVRHEPHKYKNCLSRLLNQTNGFKILMKSILSLKIKFKSTENNKKKHESINE